MSGKRTFASHTFASRTFASRTWAGQPATTVIVASPILVYGFGIWSDVYLVPTLGFHHAALIIHLHASVSITHQRVTDCTITHQCVTDCTITTTG
jgi:hypothetical protein